MLSVLLGPDGLEVEACTTALETEMLPRGYRVRALIVDAALPDGDGVDVIDRLRSAGHLAVGAGLIVLADRVDGALQRRVAGIGGHVLPKPASLLDIVDIVRATLAGPRPREVAVQTEAPEPAYFLRGPEPGAPRPVAAAEPRVAPRVEAPRVEAPRQKRAWKRDGARILSRLWAKRADGVLHVTGPTPAWVTLSDGGTLGPEAVVALEDALSGAEVSWEACEVEDGGDRAALGRLLWRAALEAVSGEPVLGLVPAGSALADAAELPLTAAARRCLGRLGGGLSVQALARREGARVDDVALDFAALRWLGLLTLAEPEAHGAGGVAVAQVGRVAGPSRAPEADAVADAPSVTRREVVAPTSRPQPPRERAPAAPERVDDPATSATASLMPVARLRREVEILRSADPWTVLGIARRSPLEVVRASATRMRQRYRRVEGDPNPESRDLAAEILARIDAAENELGTGKGVPEPVFEGLFRSGVAALTTGDFARADRILAQARQHRPDDPGTLAHLGWARFKNPDHPAETREDDGADLVELALQFDINCAQAWAYRGEMALVRGDPEEARQCFSTAMKLDPSLHGSRAR